ncbi:MAG: pentapeptide repeat-containing protein [Methanotrichaceae archaeon]|nr:pentapeptide repeat-containing protein [Methanotrichaceae archaeon]
MGEKTRLILILAVISFLFGSAHSEYENYQYYNGMVNASEILEKIGKGEPVEYDHVIVKGNLDLAQLDLPTRHIERDPYEIYRGRAENQTIIGALIRINDSSIEGMVNSNNTFFNNSIDFGGTIFNNDANFWDSTFNSYAGFVDSTFNSNASFVDSTFNSYAGFVRPTFNCYANFGGSTYNSDAYFWGSNFRSVADFTGSTFNRDAYFLYSNFSSYASFWDSTFNSKANFFDAMFKGVTFFTGSEFIGDALFQDTTFLEPLNLTRTKYDKLYIRWYNLKKGLVYDDAAYLSLIKNFKDLGYLEDYDLSYFQYRKERRNQDWPGINDWEEKIRKALDYPLEWFYGYGTRPLSAFLISIGIIFLFGLFWWGIGLGGIGDVTKADLPPEQEWEHRGIADIMGYSATVFLSGTKFFIDTPPIPRIAGKSRSLIKKAFTFERLLGTLFSILLLIAIGGTIVRSA